MTRKAHTPALHVTRGTRLLVIVAVLVGLILAATATAVDPTLVDPSPGMTGPAGMFRDDNGDLWVSDSHAGLCRVLENHPAGTSALVESPWCAPTPAVTRGGPVAPGQAAYAKLGNYVWVGDGASNSGGVWRFTLQQVGGVNQIASGEKIIDYSSPLVRDRVFGMAYDPAVGPEGALDFATKNSTSIQRLTDAKTCGPVLPATPCTPGAMGSATDSAAASLIHDASGKLYVTDLAGVGVIDPTSLDTAAKPVPGLNAGVYTALAYDPVEGRVYAGTTNGEGADFIDALRVSDGAVTTYSEGFAAVTAINVDRDSQPIAGGLDVVDDPCLKTACEDVGGTGRRFIVTYEAFVPRPIIIDGPPSATNAGTVSFAYTYPSNTTFYCALNSAPYEPCGVGDRAQKSYSSLADGGYLFQVRAGNPVTGPVAKRRFTLDRTAPVITIQPPIVSGSSVEVPFLASELNVSSSCRINGLPPTPCDSPVRYTGLANGVHRVEIQASDFLGNQGPVAGVSFRIGPPPSPPWKPGKITATLRGQTLRVVFNAPPDAKFARFTLTKKSIYPVRTIFVAVKGGKRNTVSVTLPRTSAQRIHTASRSSKSFSIRIDAGATKKRLSAAGTGRLRILAPLTAKQAG